MQTELKSKLSHMSHVSAEKKANIFKTFGGVETNTGSIYRDWETDFYRDWETPTLS